MSEVGSRRSEIGGCPPAVIDRRYRSRVRVPRLRVGTARLRRRNEMRRQAGAPALQSSGSDTPLREVIHFYDRDAGAAILARDNRGVWAGRQCRDNR